MGSLFLCTLHRNNWILRRKLFNLTENALGSWGGAMEERRHDKRVICGDSCIVYLGDLHQVAKVMNISFGGALLQFNFPPTRFRAGANCTMSVGGEFPREYSCKVTWVENPYVALMFIGLHEFETVDH